MGLPSFFKIPQHKTFSYTPRYYDERKENLQERIKKIEQEMGVNKGERYKPKISKGSMRGYIYKNKKAKKQSNLRLIIILLTLLFLTYLIFSR